MKRNVGPLDRVIRILAGLFLMALAVTGPENPLGWLGLFPLLTGVFGFCPVYAVLGINTCSLRDRSSQGTSLNNMMNTNINHSDSTTFKSRRAH